MGPICYSINGKGRVPIFGMDTLYRNIRGLPLPMYCEIEFHPVVRWFPKFLTLGIVKVYCTTFLWSNCHDTESRNSNHRIRTTIQYFFFFLNDWIPIGYLIEIAKAEIIVKIICKHYIHHRMDVSSFKLSNWNKSSKWKKQASRS